MVALALTLSVWGVVASDWQAVRDNVRNANKKKYRIMWFMVNGLY